MNTFRKVGARAVLLALVLISLFEPRSTFAAVAASSEGSNVFSKVTSALQGMDRNGTSTARYHEQDPGLGLVVLDLNNDGWLDIATGEIQLQFFTNHPGQFTNRTQLKGLTSDRYRMGKAADFDNNGWIDLTLESIATNSLGVFTEALYVDGAYNGGSDYEPFDFDNDGQLDVLMTSSRYQYPLVSRKEGSGFKAILAGIDLPGAKPNGSVAPVDFDNDGWNDIWITGKGGNELASAGLYLNQNGSVIKKSQGPGLYASTTDWADYDNDGDVDLVVTGSTAVFGATSPPLIYRNDLTNLSVISLGTNLLSRGSARWGDFNNDGLSDVIVTGAAEIYDHRYECYLWLNTGSNFVSEPNSFPGIAFGSAEWLDMDRDGRLDLAFHGVANGTSFYWGPFRTTAELWRNQTAIANTAPTAPTNLTSSVDADYVTLNWSAGSDAQTPVRGLSYNLRIGRGPARVDVLSPMADPTNGTRRLLQMGNAQNRLFAIYHLPPGTYTWSVQTIDNGFLGSPFAGEKTFTIGSRPPPKIVSSQKTDVFIVRFEGEVAAQFRLLVSPDLLSWQPTPTNRIQYSFEPRHEGLAREIMAGRFEVEHRTTSPEQNRFYKLEQIK